MTYGGKDKESRKLRKCYEEGTTARKAGVPREHNPYGGPNLQNPKFPRRRIAWNQGYDHGD